MKNVRKRQMNMMPRTDPDQPKQADPDDPLYLWSSIKAELYKASKAILKARGFNWTTFKELEAHALEQARHSGAEQIVMPDGTVQVVASPKYLHKATVRMDDEFKLHFIPITREE